MSQEGISLDEKRIYGDERETTVAYVASGVGLARVAVSGDQVGRVGLVHRGEVADVAGAGGRVLVATPEDVLVGTGEEFDPTGFGPAVAVGVGGDDLVAAGPDGRVATRDGDDWTDCGTVEDPRRFDGAYLAAGDGVHRVADGGLEALGLARARDVAAAGPYAATGQALHRLVDGEWTVAREGTAEMVAADGDRAHLAAANVLFERSDEDWVEVALPAEARVADVAYGEAPYVVTVDGTFLVDADTETTPDGNGGWRHRSLGIPGVSAIAVP